VLGFQGDAVVELQDLGYIGRDIGSGILKLVVF